MSVKIHLAIPPNIVRTAADEIRAAFPDAVVLPPQTHDEMDHFFGNVFGCPDDTADLTVTAYPSAYARVRNPAFHPEFDDMPADLPTMRPELADADLIEPCTRIKVIGVVPLLIIHHRDVVPAPKGWSDLCRKDIAERMVIPPVNTPAPAIYAAALTRLCGEKGKMAARAAHAGMLPQDINRAVDTGDYKAGMVFPAFARTFRRNGAKMVWPSEGAIPIPLAAFLKNNTPNTARDVLRYLVSAQFQTYLSRYGLFCPIRPDVPLFEEMHINRAGLLWPGWESYLELGRRSART